MYLDSTSTFNATIDTLADLGIATTSRMITQHKNAISKKHAKTVNSILADYVKNTMILNIDDYYSIHTKQMPNMTTISTITHFATVLMNLIAIQRVILNTIIHNPILVDAKLIKINVANKFIMLYSFSHNQR